MTAEHAQRDICRIIDDLPVVFTWADAEYVGTRGGLVQSRRNVEGGMFDAPELTITTCFKKVNSSGKLVDRFPCDGEPKAGFVISKVGGQVGKNYSIVRTHTDEYGAALQLDLESAGK